MSLQVQPVSGFTCLDSIALLPTKIIDFIVLNYDNGVKKNNFFYPPMNFINIDQN